MAMDKKSRKALQLLREIKSVTVATVNTGQPAARIIGEIFESNPMWIALPGMWAVRGGVSGRCD